MRGSGATRGGTVDMYAENGKIVVVIKAMKEEPNSFCEKSKVGKIKNRGYIGEQHWHDLDIADNLAAAIKATYKKENRDGVSVIEVVIPSI